MYILILLSLLRIDKSKNKGMGLQQVLQDSTVAMRQLAKT